MSQIARRGQTGLQNTSRGAGGRLQRRTGQALDIIDAETDLQVARIQAVSHVGSSAMQANALVSQLEGQLAQLVPLATTRLQAIGDMTALATVEIVQDTVRRIK